MTISAVWVWLIAALVLGGSEILTGTFLSFGTRCVVPRGRRCRRTRFRCGLAVFGVRRFGGCRVRSRASVAAGACG